MVAKHERCRWGKCLRYGLLFRDHEPCQSVEDGPDLVLQRTALSLGYSSKEYERMIKVLCCLQTNTPAYFDYARDGSSYGMPSPPNVVQDIDFVAKDTDGYESSSDPFHDDDSRTSRADTFTYPTSHGPVMRKSDMNIPVMMDPTRTLSIPGATTTLPQEI